MAKTNVLPMKVKKFIVTALASGCGVAEIANMVRDRYKVETTYAQIARYNPLRVSGSSLSAPLKKLFMEKRAKAIEATDETDLAHKAIRLHRLDYLMDRAEATNDTKLQVSVLDLARKEMAEFVLLSPDDGEE
jgi:hypothetical protein